MNRKRLALAIAFAAGLLLSACGGATVGPSPEQMPLVLADDLFKAGYELVDYQEIDVDRDGTDEALAVLTSKLQDDLLFISNSYVVLFNRSGDAWSLAGGQQIEGGNATAKLDDFTGDSIPELVVSTERKHAQHSDLVTPPPTTGYLAVFTISDGRLLELEMVESSLWGMGRRYPRVAEWENRPAVQVARGLSTTEGPLWQFYEIETFAWDGVEFSSVQVQERRRVDPLILWMASENAPWIAAFLALGSLLSWGVFVLARRTKVGKRWGLLGAALAIVAGGIGLRLMQEWLCVLAPIVAGFAGLLAGWRAAQRSRQEPG